MNLKKILEKLEKTVRISPVFRMKMWYRLRKKAHELQKEQKLRLLTWKGSMAGILAVIFILSGGTGAYAYTSPSVADGALLFPIKLALERVEEGFQKTDEDRARFHAKMMIRRIAESKRLAAKGGNDNRTLEMMNERFTKSVEMSENLEKREEFFSKIEERLNFERDKRFKRLDQKLQNHINFIEERRKAQRINETPEGEKVRIITPVTIPPIKQKNDRKTPPGHKPPDLREKDTRKKPDPGSPEPPAFYTIEPYEIYTDEAHY